MAVSLDVYDPIYCTVYFDRAGCATRVDFITHSLKGSQPIVKSTGLDCVENEEYIVDWIFSLDSCQYYADYRCSGLDGSELWIETASTSNTSRVLKFWSPSSQPSNQLATKLTNLQKGLTERYSLDQREAEFAAELKKGTYWNFGESQVKID